MKLGVQLVALIAILIVVPAMSVGIFALRGIQEASELSADRATETSESSIATGNETMTTMIDEVNASFHENVDDVQSTITGLVLNITEARALKDQGLL